MCLKILVVWRWSTPGQIATCDYCYNLDKYFPISLLIKQKKYPIVTKPLHKSLYFIIFKYKYGPSFAVSNTYYHIYRKHYAMMQRKAGRLKSAVRIYWFGVFILFKKTKSNKIDCGCFACLLFFTWFLNYF